MSDFFDTGGPSSESGLDDYQHDLLWPLRNYAMNALSSPDPAIAQLKASLLKSGSAESKALAERTWREGFLDPVVNDFKSRALPAINSSFSRIGGSLSSRRDKTIADALGNVTSQASGQFSQMLPQIMAFPLQQTLGQIQGLGSLTETQWSPFRNASQFALSSTRQATQNQPGPFWGLANSAAQVGGFALGGGFGSGSGGPSLPGYTTYNWSSPDQISRIKGY